MGHFIIFLGLLVLVTSLGVKFAKFIFHEEFEIFEFLVKLALGIILGGGVILLLEHL